MSAQPRPCGASPLITAAGAAHVVYGLVFVGLAVWVLVAGADAVSKTLLAGEELKKVGEGAPGLNKEQAKQAEAGIDVAGKGIAGVFAAMAGVAAGCLIIQGLPLCLVGLGVIYRKNWARILAFVLAV